MMTRNNRSRRGAAVIYALAITAVVAILTADVAQHVMATRRLLEGRHHHLQAVWLARSGIEVATAKLLSDADYKGEQFEAIVAGQVDLKIEKTSSSPAIYTINSSALFPAGERTAIHHSLQRIV